MGRCAIDGGVRFRGLENCSVRWADREGWEEKWLLIELC